MMRSKRKEKSEKQLQFLWLKQNSKNRFMFNAKLLGYESDILEISPDRVIHEIEIKRSFSDFKAEKNKVDKFNALPCNYFSYYFSCRELSDKCISLINPKYGIYFHEYNYITCVRKEVIIHDNVMPYEDLLSGVLANSTTHFINRLMNG